MLLLESQPQPINYVTFSFKAKGLKYCFGVLYKCVCRSFKFVKKKLDYRLRISNVTLMAMFSVVIRGKFL